MRKRVAPLPRVVLGRGARKRCGSCGVLGGEGAKSGGAPAVRRMHVAPPHRVWSKSSSARSLPAPSRGQYRGSVSLRPAQGAQSAGARADRARPWAPRHGGGPVVHRARPERRRGRALVRRPSRHASASSPSIAHQAPSDASSNTEDAERELLGMGFSRRRVRAAIRNVGSSLQGALSWLLDNHSVAGSDGSAQIATHRSVTSAGGGSDDGTQPPPRKAARLSVSDHGSRTPTPPSADADPPRLVGRCSRSRSGRSAATTTAGPPPPPQQQAASASAEGGAAPPHGPSINPVTPPGSPSGETRRTPRRPFSLSHRRRAPPLFSIPY